ncbi:hypothetical protein SAMN05421742_105196 [Roseospirillum parvum]|uniref:Uncharacterized protein n=1 Tax=Roseospirillum parvum TaxID=83401 RepID=A0A1G8B4P5_9PROT|nr:hypothetical protein SAMN05421742_105196 [Roseospirillum parvum]
MVRFFRSVRAGRNRFMLPIAGPRAEGENSEPLGGYRFFARVGSMLKYREQIVRNLKCSAIHISHDLL